jgi:hypothetical protein
MNAFIDGSGVLVSFGYMESDNDNILIEVSDDFDRLPGFSRYKNGFWESFSPVVDYTVLNTAVMLRFIESANLATVGLGDAFIAGLLSDQEAQNFKAWAAYKLALRSVDLSVETPAWPNSPSA